MKNVKSFGGRRSTFFFSCIVLLGFFVSGMGWILASPLGGSPDEDFHMGSIWCPRPVSESCETTVIKGAEHVLVPEPVAKSAACHAFHPEKSAACVTSFSDEKIVPAYRYDTGSYPRGYYRFHHLFVGEDVGTSILVMRTVNLLIALVLLSSVFIALPARYRQGFMLAMLVAWVPTGWYFINSLNPTSWAVTGIFVYTSALFASLKNEGWRRWFALVVASAGALLCICSRGDVASFIFIASVGMLLGVAWKKWTWSLRAFAFAWSLIGIYFMASGGQASIVANTHTAEKTDFFQTLFTSLFYFPNYFLSLWGQSAGLGWLDTNIDGMATYSAIIVASGVFFIALSKGGRRKWLAAAAIAGAIFAIPFLTTYKGLQSHILLYQPRYMLPLLAVFFFFVLLAGDVGKMFNRQQLLFVLLFKILSYASALGIVLKRYTIGYKAEPSVNSSWWWDIPISSGAVWVIASLAFAIASIISLIFLSRERAVSSEKILENQEKVEEFTEPTSAQIDVQA